MNNQETQERPGRTAANDSHSAVSDRLVDPAIEALNEAIDGATHPKWQDGDVVGFYQADAVEVVNRLRGSGYLIIQESQLSAEAIAAAIDAVRVDAPGPWWVDFPGTRKRLGERIYASLLQSEQRP